MGLTVKQRGLKQVREVRRIIETARAGGYFEAASCVEAAEWMAAELLRPGNYPVRVGVELEKTTTWKGLDKNPDVRRVFSFVYYLTPKNGPGTPGAGGNL